MGLLRRLKVKHYLLLGIASLILSEYLGLFRHLKEKDYDSEFTYPLAGDVSRYVNQLKAGKTPAVAPVFKHEYYMYKHPKAGLWIRIRMDPINLSYWIRIRIRIQVGKNDLQI